MIERTNGRRHQEHTAAELEGRRLAASLEPWEEAPAELEQDDGPTVSQEVRRAMLELLGFALFVALVLGGIIALELLTTGGR